MEEYYFYVLDVVSRGSIEELVQIWRAASFMGVEGKIIQTLINESVVSIGAINGVQIESGTSFKELIRLYDEKNYKGKCQGPTKECMQLAIEDRNVPLMNSVLKDRPSPDDVAQVLNENVNDDLFFPILVKYLLNNGIHFLLRIVANESLPIVKKALAMGVNHYELTKALMGAGNLEGAEYMIRNYTFTQDEKRGLFRDAMLTNSQEFARLYIDALHPSQKDIDNMTRRAQFYPEIMAVLLEHTTLNLHQL